MKHKLISTLLAAAMLSLPAAHVLGADLPCAVSGIIWEDLNDDGEINDGSYISGAQIRVTEKSSGTQVWFSSSDSGGAFAFSVAPGEYIVRITLSSAYKNYQIIANDPARGLTSFASRISPNVFEFPITAASDAKITLETAVSKIPSAYLHGFVWQDIDSDGIRPDFNSEQDEVETESTAETGIAGAVVAAYDESGTAVAAGRTDIRGEYSFEAPGYAVYKLVATVPETHYIPTMPTEGETEEEIDEGDFYFDFGFRYSESYEGGDYLNRAGIAHLITETTAESRRSESSDSSADGENDNEDSSEASGGASMASVSSGGSQAADAVSATDAPDTAESADATASPVSTASPSEAASPSPEAALPSDDPYVTAAPGDASSSVLSDGISGGSSSSSASDGSGGEQDGSEDETVPSLNKTDHYAYVVGYPDGSIMPESNITRQETASIFYRLLTDESRDYYFVNGNSFYDVQSGMWSNTAISTMTNAGILSGYENMEFLPENNITRAEFATIAAKFDSGSYSGADKFSDISGHWASGYINLAAEKGWISGYENGTFKPDAYITRAEAMTIINNILDRHADATLDGMTVWYDNTPDKWYYSAVQEAGNSHYYTKSDNSEVWTEMRQDRDWSHL